MAFILKEIIMPREINIRVTCCTAIVINPFHSQMTRQSVSVVLHQKATESKSESPHWSSCLAGGG